MWRPAGSEEGRGAGEAAALAAAAAFLAEAWKFLQNTKIMHSQLLVNSKNTISSFWEEVQLNV